MLPCREQRDERFDTARRLQQEIRFQCCYQNVGGIPLDNFAVLHYGRAARVAMRDSKVGICKSLPGSTLQTPHFTLLNFNAFNEILHYFSRRSVSWFSLDPLAYKRFGTKAGADTQTAIP